MKIEAFPLAWPVGWRRTVASERKNGQFSRRETNYRTGYDGKRQTWTSKKWLTVSDGVARIVETLERMGISRDDVVISTNVRTRLDGLPRSGEKEPDDPGAAVYWRQTYSGAPRCMAIDRYSTVADNLAAVAATLEAMRAIERHGGAEILERAFTGFAALPERSSSTWREQLGFRSDETVGLPQVEQRFRELAKTHHPDSGGDAAKFREITEARAAARVEMLQSA